MNLTLTITDMIKITEKLVFKITGFKVAELAGQEVHSLAGLGQHLDLMVESRVEHFQAVELLVVQAQVLLDHGDWTPPMIFISSSPLSRVSTFSSSAISSFSSAPSLSASNIQPSTSS